MEKNYKAFIHKGETDGYGITFPDFPGCVSDGTTIDEALANGRAAAQLYIDSVYEAGGEVPEPGSIDESWIIKECDDIAMVAVVPLDVPSRNVRLNVSMSDFVIKRVDRYAKRHGMSRSGVLTKAALELVE